MIGLLKDVAVYVVLHFAIPDGDLDLQRDLFHVIYAKIRHPPQKKSQASYCSNVWINHRNEYYISHIQLHESKLYFPSLHLSSLSVDWFIIDSVSSSHNIFTCLDRWHTCSMEHSCNTFLRLVSVTAMEQLLPLCNSVPDAESSAAGELLGHKAQQDCLPLRGYEKGNGLWNQIYVVQPR